MALVVYSHIFDCRLLGMMGVAVCGRKGAKLNETLLHVMDISLLVAARRAVDSSARQSRKRSTNEGPD